MSLAEPQARAKIKAWTKPGRESEGFIEFCKTCVTVMAGESDTGGVAMAFKLWPEQQRFARMLCGEKRIIALKARQLGMTTEVLAFFLFRALFWYDQDFRIVSINETDAKDSLERVKFMIANLPDWCRPELETSNTTTVKLAETGSVIRAIPSTKNAGRGKTLTGLLMDEDAAQVYTEMILKSASPALEKRNGWLIRLSTANGVGNSFERSWRKAEQGTGGYKPIFLNWRADPARDDDWYQRELERNDGDVQLMKQEYPETPNEAFLASGRPFFDMDRVSRDLERDLPMGEVGYLDGKEFVLQARGAIKVFKRPQMGERCVIGVDVSEGLEKGDWSVAIVRNAETLEPYARVKTKVSPVELAEILAPLGEWYAYRALGTQEVESEPALLAIEANNHGIACTSELVRMGYRRLFYMRDLVTHKVSERPGWLTTAPSRRLALGNFQSAYRTGRAPVIDREELEEMGNFFHRGAAGKPQAGPGLNDDMVMADAICITVCGLEVGVETVEERRFATEGERARVEDIERMINNSQKLNGGLIELGG